MERLKTALKVITIFFTFLQATKDTPGDSPQDEENKQDITPNPEILAKAPMFQSHEAFLDRRTRRKGARPLVTAADISKICMTLEADSEDGIEVR